MKRTFLTLTLALFALGTTQATEPVEIEKKEMPLDSYTWTHDEANLTPEQVTAIVTWGKKVQADYKQKMTTK